MGVGTVKLGLRRWIGRRIGRWVAAWLFYTAVPLPHQWPVTFQAIARLAPAIGVIIGGGLGVLDWGLAQIGLPLWPRMAVVVAAWVWITGGLHLDGAMDAADGLAVMDPERRLVVMADSATGAFGAIALGIVLLLKVTALGSLGEAHRWMGLVAAAGWGRWGQLMAIARYPYLKPEGKGKFHREEIQGWREGLMPGFGLLLVSAGDGMWTGEWIWAGAMAAGGMAIALGVGFWFYRQLGGHTGDTYGAVVEWTEALLLLWGTLW